MFMAGPVKSMITHPVGNQRANFSDFILSTSDVLLEFTVE